MKQPKTYAMMEVVKLLGISKMTMLRWLADGRVASTYSLPMSNGLTLRRFTDADVKAIKDYKERTYKMKPSQLAKKKTK